MSDQRYDVIVGTIEEGYRSFQGFHRNLVVRIEGRRSRRRGETVLFVRVYSQDGHHVGGYIHPFGSLARANRMAREIMTEMVSTARQGRKAGWPEKADHTGHCVAYRRDRASRDEPYWQNGYYRGAVLRAA